MKVDESQENGDESQVRVFRSRRLWDYHCNHYLGSL